MRQHGTAPRYASCSRIDAERFHLSFPWDIDKITAHFARILEPRSCGLPPAIGMNLSAVGLRLLGAAIDSCRLALFMSLMERKVLTELTLTMEMLTPHLETEKRSH